MTQTLKTYKPAKTLEEQVHYLLAHKNITFNDISMDESKEVLLRYNYINVITPFKHHFARKGTNKNVIKVNGNHIYDYKVDFNDYHSLFVDERNKYSTIINNILDFEIHFKSITAYHLLTNYDLSDSHKLSQHLDKLICNLQSLNYSDSRKYHMTKRINELKNDIENYSDIYCFFDRKSINDMLTIYATTEYCVQNTIFSDLVNYNMNFNVQKVDDFIKKVFCLVSIRNCVMHCSSLEILVRYYKPKEKILRTASDKKKYTSLIKQLSVK